MRSAVRSRFHALAIAMGLSLGLSYTSAGLAHPILHFDVDTVFSGGGAPPQSTPVLSFSNIAGGGGVRLMVEGMIGGEFLNQLAFNYGGSAAPSFNYVSGALAETTFASNAITVGPAGQGGAGFDILFDYPQAAATRFSGDNFDHSHYIITGAGVDETDFNLTNAAGFFAAAQIGGGGGAPFVAAVPEAEIYAMLLAGLGLLGFVMRRRRKSVAPAV